MLVGFEKRTNLASQKITITHTKLLKNTFFTHIFSNGTIENLPIFFKQKLNLFFYLWKRLYIWAIF
jgi:hypothetical protein